MATDVGVCVRVDPPPPPPQCAALSVCVPPLALSLSFFITPPPPPIIPPHKHTSALEPVISGEIMQLHHAKHHAAYVAGLVSFRVEGGEREREREG